jgi:hypothetical protein
MSWYIDLSKKLQGKSTDKVSRETRKERLAHCNSCPHLMRTGQCSKCGCFMSDKTRYKESECPIDKWGSVQ